MTLTAGRSLQPQAFAILVASLSWSVAKWCGSAEAVTCHSMIVMASHSVAAANHRWECDGPFVTVEFRGEAMPNLTTPFFEEFW